MGAYRESVRGILPVQSKNGQKKIILMHRIKNGQEYYVVPGGGINEEENHETALIREMEEEINASISVKQLIIEYVSDLYNTIQYFYLCSHEGGEIKNGQGVEFSHRSNKENIYEVKEISINELISINIVPPSIKNILLKILNEDVPNDKVTIKE
ncbi:MAG: NUDIX domain-containing protein [Candidatus Absconditabacterales bacterium]